MKIAFMHPLIQQRTKLDLATNGMTWQKPKPVGNSEPVAELAPRWERILVPIDFSLESMKTLAWSSQLAQSLGASLYLIHTLGEPSLLARIRSGPALVGKQELVDTARAKLLAITKRKIRSNVPITLSVRIGDPAREILAAVTRFSADALVLHTDVKSGLKGLLQKEIACQVVYSASCPVFLIPRQVLWQSDRALPLVRPNDWRAILVPIEMTSIGEQVLSQGLTLAGWFHAKVTAFNVVRAGRLNASYRPTRASNQRFVTARSTFHCWVRRHTPASFALKTYVGMGKPAPTFLQAARHLKVHLIVVGTQQFAGWRRLRSTYAISQILSETPCPILSIPQPPGGGKLQALTASAVIPAST